MYYYVHTFDIPRVKGDIFCVTANATSRVLCSPCVYSTPITACRECHSLQSISGPHQQVFQGSHYIRTYVPTPKKGLTRCLTSFTHSFPQTFPVCIPRHCVTSGNRGDLIRFLSFRCKTSYLGLVKSRVFLK